MTFRYRRRNEGGTMQSITYSNSRVQQYLLWDFCNKNSAFLKKQSSGLRACKITVVKGTTFVLPLK